MTTTEPLSAAEAASGVTVTLTARTDGDWADAAPADVRLRRGLKELGRRFGLAAAWPEPAPCAVCPLAAGAKGRGGRK